MNIRRWDQRETLPWALLLDADPSRTQIRKYVRRGELWLAEIDGKIVGAMVLMQTRVDVLEIMNIATDAELRGQGLGTALLEKAKRCARQSKATRLHVGTGNNSFRQLQFYQRFGFRVLGVDKDFFVGRYRRTYQCDGIVLRDMIRMELAV